MSAPVVTVRPGQRAPLFPAAIVAVDGVDVGYCVTDDEADRFAYTLRVSPDEAAQHRDWQLEHDQEVSR